MTTVVRDKLPIVIPETIRRRAGIAVGDQVVFKVSRGIITVASGAALVKDRSRAASPSKTELAAIRAGRAQIKAGEYVTLEKLTDALATSNRQARKKGRSRLSH